MSRRRNLVNELLNLADAVRDALTIPDPAYGEWDTYYHVAEARARYVRDILAPLAELRDADPDLATVQAQARAVAKELDAARHEVRVTYTVSAGRCDTCGGPMWAVECEDGGEVAECPWCDHPSFGATSDHGEAGQ